MKDWLGWIRRSAPLLICFGVIFPFAVSPFGILSCSKKGSFLPESRSTLRQWLPMNINLDESADRKEDPSTLGFTEGEIYYFDELTITGLIFGFLLLGCWRSLYPRPILAGILTGMIWTYLSLLLFLVYYHSWDPQKIWLQPGVLLISGGYGLLTLAAIADLRAWILQRKRAKRKNSR